MNAATLSALLTSLESFVGPELVAFWAGTIKPALQAEVAKANVDLQVVGTALIAALDSIITVEAPKI